MRRIAISEPHDDVQALYRLVVERLGHEPVAVSPADEDNASVDVLVVEPASPIALQVARRLRGDRPRLPIVCVSIYPPGPEVADLDPLAYLVKPFGLAEFERALNQALAAAPAAV